MKKPNKEKIICRVCQKVGYYSVSEKRKYCTRKCYLIDQPNTVHRKRVPWECGWCKKKDMVAPHDTKKKFCSKECFFKGRIVHSGKTHYNHKGGYLGQNGYRYIRFGGKYHLEHRTLYEKHYGIKVPEEFCVHHKDGNPLNNKIENLEMLSKSEHTRLHVLKFSDAEILSAYKLYLTGKFTHRELGNMIGMHRSHISRRFKRLKELINGIENKTPV